MAIHPTSVKNSHLGHLFFWVLFLPVLSIVLLPFFLKDLNIDPKEVQMVRTFNVDTEKVQTKANSTFSTLFIKTGLMPASERFFAPKKNSQVSGGMFQGSVTADWVRGVWLMIYKMIWRWYALAWIFLIPAIALCLPAAVDGLMMRARKVHEFEVSNPVFFYSSAHVVTMALGMLLFWPLAPITMSGILLFGLIIAMASAIWVTASNLQTGS